MKSLNLDREKYRHLLNSLNCENFNVKKEEKPGNLIIYRIIVTGQEPALLNIYEKPDGSTTLHYKVGKNQELSLKIANRIVDECSIKEFNTTSFYIKSIRDEDFNVILEFLSENGNTIEIDDKNDKGKRQVTIKGIQGDKIVLTKHSNDSFQVQGKPKLLFSEIIEILSDLLPFKEVIEEQLKFYEIELTPADIQGELEAKLPDSYDKLNEKLKTIIVPSLALSKINFSIQLDDYSAFAYPCLRGIEGVIKQIFNNNGVNSFRDNTIGKYFDNLSNKFTPSNLLDEAISDKGVKDKLCKLYKFYKLNRHGLFHVDDIIQTSKTISLEQASSIILKTLELIEDSSEYL